MRLILLLCAAATTCGSITAALGVGGRSEGFALVDGGHDEADGSSLDNDDGDEDGPNRELLHVSDVDRHALETGARSPFDVDGEWSLSDQSGVESGTWETIRPGGATGCVKGDEFAFFVRRGKVNKVALYLDGGGACWSFPTCRAPTCTTNLNIGGFAHNMASNNNGFWHPDSRYNPLADWTFVAVPYCSCDGHTGNKTSNYNFGLVMSHRGRANVAAALDWIKLNVHNPEATFMTGCSAGSVGSYVWAPHLFEAFPDAKHYHLGDSYAPVFGQSGWNEGNAAWDMSGVLPDWIPGLNWTSWHPLVCVQELAKIANFYPNATFATYSSAHDAVEMSFYSVEGAGGGALWSSYRDKAYDYLAKATKNVATFKAKGMGQ